MALQEELDWLVYGAYGLVEDDTILSGDVPIESIACPRGERPFELECG